VASGDGQNRTVEIDEMLVLVPFAAIWLFTVALIIATGTWVPSSSESWWALLVLGPPLYVIAHVVLEAVWDWGVSTPLMRRADQHASKPLRFIVHLLYFVLFCGLVVTLLLGALWLWLWIKH
jgi:hypothetical protein